MSLDNIPFILTLDEKAATNLEVVGGKGANLALLYQRKFDVPKAFLITTSAYQCAVNNKEITSVLSKLDNIDVSDMEKLEKLSANIKEIICKITLPNDLNDLILKHYDKLCDKSNDKNAHVAVRSSATAEDLPDLSFAGQQDSYLHVTKENLIDKVKECWASLFTARAISYRKTSNIDDKSIKLAVVVQQMIPSEVAGVAFTANPLTGLRDEVVIDATYGLGEALVSGMVTPDHYEILMNSENKNQQAEIRVKNLGENSVKIIGKEDGGTETLDMKDNQENSQALSDESILKLAKLAKQIEKSYDSKPQDLEWGLLNGKFYILQSRSITTLYPIPISTPGQTNLRCMMSYNNIQGILDPLTPLGQSAIRVLYCGMLRDVGVNQSTTLEDDISSDPLRHHIMKSSSYHLWLDITGILTSAGKKMFGISIQNVEMGRIIEYLKYSGMFPKRSFFSSLKSYLVLFFLVIPLILRSIRNFLFPRYAKNKYTRQMEKYHQFVDNGFQNPNKQKFSDYVKHSIHTYEVLASKIARYGAPCLIPGIATAKIIGEITNDQTGALSVTRAVESNTTVEMNLMLWKITLLIRDNSKILKLFENETADQLVDMLENKSLDKNLQTQIDEFFRIYGCRGFGEVDIGRKRWCDEPKAIIEQIKGYLKITDSDKGIDKVHEKSKEDAYKTLNQMENDLKNSSFKRYLLNFVFHRSKILGSLRESPKFELVQTHRKCREYLLSKANDVVQENFISQPDDITFLYMKELEYFALDFDQKNSNKISYWKDLISQRRDEYNKFMLSKRVPVVVLSNGTTYYDASTIPDEDNENNENMELGDDELAGVGASSGTYEGKVRIVEDPNNANLQPDEILVCTATDPAWTALFSLIGALVLEMGGMVQHGAIVAREYGIPSIVGVVDAKKRLKTGQTIQVNGSNGRIKILSDS